MTHTPGPWKVDGVPYDGYEDPTIISSVNNQYVAQTTYDMQTCTQRDTVDADTYLIAAAPDLLEAVEAMVRAYPYSDIVDGELCTCGMCKAYRIGKAAIELTKKEGE